MGGKGEEVQSSAAGGEKQQQQQQQKIHHNRERERERERARISQEGGTQVTDFCALFPHPSLRHLSGLRERERESEEGRETLSCHYENTVCFRFLFCFPLSWQR